jgi:hypothetical protein
VFFGPLVEIYSSLPAAAVPDCASVLHARRFDIQRGVQTSFNGDLHTNGEPAGTMNIAVNRCMRRATDTGGLDSTPSTSRSTLITSYHAASFHVLFGFADNYASVSAVVVG